MMMEVNSRIVFIMYDHYFEFESKDLSYSLHSIIPCEIRYDIFLYFLLLLK